MSTTGTTMTARKIRCSERTSANSPHRAPANVARSGVGRSWRSTTTIVKQPSTSSPSGSDRRPVSSNQKPGYSAAMNAAKMPTARREVPTTDEPGHRDDPEADGRREQLERFEAAPTEPHEPSEDRHPSQGGGSPSARRRRRTQTCSQGRRQGESTRSDSSPRRRPGSSDRRAPRPRSARPPRALGRPTAKARTTRSAVMTTGVKAHAWTTGSSRTSLLRPDPACCSAVPDASHVCAPSIPGRFVHTRRTTPPPWGDSQPPVHSGVP